MQTAYSLDTAGIDYKDKCDRLLQYENLRFYMFTNNGSNMKINGEFASGGLFSLKTSRLLSQNSTSAGQAFNKSIFCSYLYCAIQAITVSWLIYYFNNNFQYPFSNDYQRGDIIFISGELVSLVSFFIGMNYRKKAFLQYDADLWKKLGLDGDR
jgi:hypothetical protein